MDKGVVFQAYIANLGLYNSGIDCGKWISFPLKCSKENLNDEIRKILSEIKIDEMGNQEYFFADFDSCIIGLTRCFYEYDSITLLNVLANEIVKMDCSIEKFESMLEYGTSTYSVEELVNLIRSSDSFLFLDNVNSDYDLGYEYAENSGLFTESLNDLGTLRNYIDYEGYGRDIRLREGGMYTLHGYIAMTDDIKTSLDAASVE
jgi:antirestriction protein